MQKDQRDHKAAHSLEIGPSSPLGFSGESQTTSAKWPVHGDVFGLDIGKAR
jgi:hypothetical protein